MPSATTLRSLLTLLTLAASAAFALRPPESALIKPSPPTAPPPPRFVVPQASQPIQLRKAAVQVTVAGTQAQTRIELVVHNPNPRQLEATLDFPLGEGQSVVGFALDINGEMVSAVPVPKDKGRQVFDDISRRRVDPALLERTAGNSFKLRIYPLPPNGQRRVVLQLAESLRPDASGRFQYALPLDFGQPVGQFEGRFGVQGGAVPQASGALAGAESWVQAGEAGLQLKRSDWQPGQPLTMSWTGRDGDSLAVQHHAGSAYAYAELPVDLATGPARLPREVHLVWDASGSGAQRDHAREFALLDALFAAAPQLRVHLTVARNVAEPVQRFDIRGGDWSALRRVLEGLAYDGASSASAWAAGFAPARPDGDALALLFSDGLVTWPDGAKPPVAGLPLFAINAATRFDAPRLRRLAEGRGGRFIDLNLVDAPAALAALTQPGLRLADIQAQGADRIVTQSAWPENGRLVLAARLTAPKARLLLTLVDAQGQRQQRSLELVAPTPNAGNGDESIPLAARRWAELRVAELEADRQRNRAEIRRLGEQFRLLSSETSLIVLDSLADYVRYEIVPPTASMRAAYQQQLAQRGAERGRSREAHLDDLAGRFAERQAWWQQTFRSEPPKQEPVAVRTPAIAPSVVTQVAPAPALTAPPPSAKPAANEMLIPVVPIAEPRVAVPLALPMPAPVPAPAPAAARAGSVARDDQRAERKLASETGKAGSAEPTAGIALRRWEPNAAYARRLREASDADRYGVYLDERPGYLSSTAFFLDAAEIFFAKGQRALALRVLSNLAEMELENRHVLRILAYRLLQADELAVAVPLLERVRELAPDEPQSSRDLALALMRAGQAQRAVELLWDVASQPWDARFADIDLIAVGEMNAILARNPRLDRSRIDARLLRNLPLDLRAVLSWDADNTDIDLHVIDPDGEEAYFGNNRTQMGGAVSRDFTGGYGPEEFSLRRAKPGRYQVRAQFFGHNQQIVSPYTTLMLWFSTGFGTDAQKDQRVVLRLSSQGEQVLVGSFEVAPPAKGGAK